MPAYIKSKRKGKGKRSEIYIFLSKIIWVTAVHSLGSQKLALLWNVPYQLLPAAYIDCSLIDLG